LGKIADRLNRQRVCQSWDAVPDGASFATETHEYRGLIKRKPAICGMSIQRELLGKVPTISLNLKTIVAIPATGRINHALLNRPSFVNTTPAQKMPAR
jgi:hypothetical protein